MPTRQDKISALRRLRPEDSLEQKSDDWIDAAFDHEMKRIEDARNLDELAAVNIASAPARGGPASDADATPDGRLDAAMSAHARELVEESKAGAPRGSMTRESIGEATNIVVSTAQDDED